MTKAIQSIYIAMIVITWFASFVLLVLISKNSSLTLIKLAQTLYLKSLYIVAIISMSTMILILLSRAKKTYSSKKYAQNVDLDFRKIANVFQAFGFGFGSYVCLVKVNDVCYKCSFSI